MAKEITNNGFTPSASPIAGGRSNNTNTDASDIGTPLSDWNSMFDQWSSQNAFTNENATGLYNTDHNDLINGTIGESDDRTDWNKYWDSLGLSAEERYRDALQRQSNAKTAADKEKWANIAAQLQSEIMRDSDRAYNSATSQVERLMAAGMSRQAAMAAVQGIASEGQAAGVQNEAPTRAQEYLNRAQQVGEVCSSLMSTASGAFGLYSAVKQFPLAMKLLNSNVNIAGSQERSASALADTQEISAWYAQRQRTAAQLADSFAAACFGSYSTLLALHEEDPEKYPMPNGNPHSVKEAKDLIAAGAAAGCEEALTYQNSHRKALEANVLAQSMVQQAFKGFEEGKAYHPQEDAWSFLDNQLKYGAMTTQQNFFNSCTAGRKMQSEIELNNEDCKTAGYMRAKLSAETGLAVSQTQGQEIANQLAELDYEVRTDYTAYECAYYAGQTEILLSAYDQGLKSAEASRIANDANYQSWVASQRYQYILDPTGYEQANAGSPWLLRLVQDKAGTLGAMTSYYNMQSAEGQAQVSQYTGEHAAGVVGLGMINDNLKAIGTLFGGYGVANSSLRIGQYHVGFNQSVSQGAQPYNYQTNGITLPSANYHYQ